MSRSDHDLMSAQQVRGEARGQLRGQVLDHLELPLGGHGVEQLVDARLEEGLVLVHGLGREPPAEEAALLDVLGVVEGDGVRLVHVEVGPIGAT